MSELWRSANLCSPRTGITHVTTVTGFYTGAKDPIPQPSKKVL